MDAILTFDKNRKFLNQMPKAGIEPETFALRMREKFTQSNIIQSL